MKKYTGKINIYSLIEGAKKAKGLTVIIDVFRAFSLECYLYSLEAASIRPVGTIEEAFKLKEKNPNYLLFGERNGSKCEGFDYGNSPSEIKIKNFKNKNIIHTTSAGTQGIINAVNADKIITGSLLNAKAIAKYILNNNPDEVSLVAMGNSGIRTAPEDELCAEYIKNLLIGNDMPDLDRRISDLQFNGGEHFFDENNQDVYPEEDFWLCIKHDIFNFVIEVDKDKDGFITKKIDINY